MSESEIYTRRIEGYCNCGCETKIIKYENSKKSSFRHGHQYTTEGDIGLRENIFRCRKCLQEIDKTFIIK